jgi:hypothetical protein
VRSNSRNPLPSWRQQLTAGFAAALVLALAVLAASPQLHAWVHDHGLVPVKGSAAPAGHEDQPSGQDDTGCVVVMFANGVVCAALALMAITALWQFINLLPRVETAACRQTPRYWLPPLCGPPLG